MPTPQKGSGIRKKMVIDCERLQLFFCSSSQCLPKTRQVPGLVDKEVIGLVQRRYGQMEQKMCIPGNSGA